MGYLRQKHFGGIPQVPRVFERSFQLIRLRYASSSIINSKNSLSFKWKPNEKKVIQSGRRKYKINPENLHPVSSY